MGSQLPYNDSEETTFKGDDMAQTMAFIFGNRAYDHETYGSISPFRSIFAEGLNAGPTPDDYLSQPNTLNGLYSDAYGDQGMHPSFDDTTHQGIQQGSSSVFVTPQMPENQYYPGVQQNHHESYDYAGGEQDDQVPEYPIPAFASPEARRAHQGGSSSTNLPASSERSPHDSSPLADPAPATPPAPRALRFTNFVEAEAAATNRARPIIADDDWAAVKASPAQYVQTLLSAFSADYAATSDSSSLAKPADAERWLAYQASQVAKTAKYGDEKIEAACWVLLKNLIEAHEVGLKQLQYHKSEDNIKCTDHVDLIADAIRDYGVIRYDVVRLQRLDELVCCTRSATQRKLANFRGNANKISRDTENQQNAQARGFKYVPVLGDKKRKTSGNQGNDNDAAFAGRAASKKPRTLAPVSDFPADSLPYDTTTTEEVPSKRVARKKGKAVAFRSFDFTDGDDELSSQTQ